MTRITTAWILGAITLFGFLSPQANAQPSSGEPVSFPTNMAMLTDAAQSSVSEMFLSFDIPKGASVLLESESLHEAKWFVENLILGQLTDRGFVVTLKSEREEDSDSSPDHPGRPAYQDTSVVAQQDSVSLDDALATTDPGEDEGVGGPGTPAMLEEALLSEPEVDYVLRFRVAECGLTYPKAFRKSPFGTKLVQRFATVSVFGTLVKGDRESVVWVGRGDAERLDHVPSGKLGLLEGKTFPFTHPEVESRGIGAYAEPALVLSIVMGLVYLFYTNQ